MNKFDQVKEFVPKLSKLFLEDFAVMSWHMISQLLKK